MSKIDSLKKLIDEGYQVKNKNYTQDEWGSWISGEEYEHWISKVIIFVRANYPQNPLEEKLLESCSNAVGNSEDYFNSIIGTLKALIDMDEQFNEIDCNVNQCEKITKIFISHSTQDSVYAELLVGLLNGFGLKKDREVIFCSSVPGFDIPQGEKIYDYLKQQFQENIWVIFLLSDNYYESAASLNEMGATWVTSKKYTSIVLPPFKFLNIRGAIDPTLISFELDNKNALNEFRSDVIRTFELSEINSNIWEADRDRFLTEIQHRLKEDLRNQSKHKIYVEGTSENNSEAIILLRFENKSLLPTKCQYSRIKLIDTDKNEVEFDINSDYLDSILLRSGENRYEEYSVMKESLSDYKFNFRKLWKWESDSNWGLM